MSLDVYFFLKKMPEPQRCEIYLNASSMKENPFTEGIYPKKHTVHFKESSVTQACVFR